MRFLALLPLLGLCEACNGQTSQNTIFSDDADCRLQGSYFLVSPKSYDQVKRNCRQSKAQL